MTCPNCKSSNIQSHIVTEDKRSRNAKILVVALLSCIVVPLLIALIGGNNLFFPIFLGIIIAFPVTAVLKIILTIIPARKKTVFVCNECGTQFEQGQPPHR